MKKEEGIGIKVKLPAKSCEDKNCPFHGNLKVRGRLFTGIITNTDAHKSATIEFERKYYVPKYERQEKRKTRLRVHNPGCIDAKKGDKVKVSECRPLSKTKKFVIIEKISTDVLFKQREEALEESKVKEKEKKEKIEEEDNKNPVEYIQMKFSHFLK